MLSSSAASTAAVTACLFLTGVSVEELEDPVEVALEGVAGRKSMVEAGFNFL
jgi:hypothetical protein